MKNRIVFLIICFLLISSFVTAQNTIIDSNGITVDGTIESTSGGVVFPDASTQTSSNPALEVYDNNNQFLGLSMSREMNGFWIYVPSVDEMIYIDLSTGNTFSVDIYFQSSNCTGDPYIQATASYSIHRNNNKYYIGELIAPTILQFNSRLQVNGSCNPLSNVSIPRVRAFEGTPPFPLPVALPLNFQYRGSH